jgi:hypothetical protein
MSSVEPLCSLRYANEMRLMGSWKKRRSACKSLNFRYEIRRSDLGETIPPCGEPFSGYCTAPSGSNTSAFSHLLMRRRQGSSSIRSRNSSISFFVIDFVEEAANVRLDQEVIAPASELCAQVPDRIQGTDVGPVAVAARKHKPPGSPTASGLGSRSLTTSSAAGSPSVTMGSRSLTGARQQDPRLTLSDNKASA